jgi:hypothetical protein
MHKPLRDPHTIGIKGLDQRVDMSRHCRNRSEAQSEHASTQDMGLTPKPES